MIIWWSGSPPWSHDSDQRHDHQNKTHVFSSCDNDTGWETLVPWAYVSYFILYMLIIEQLNDRNRQTETRDISHQHKHWWALNQTSHEHSRHGKNRLAVWRIQDFDAHFLTFNWSYQLKSSHLHLAPSTRGVMITDQHKRPWCSWKNSPHAHVCSVRSYLWCTHTLRNEEPHGIKLSVTMATLPWADYWPIKQTYDPWWDAAKRSPSSSERISRRNSS